MYFHLSNLTPLLLSAYGENVFFYPTLLPYSFLPTEKNVFFNQPYSPTPFCLRRKMYLYRTLLSYSSTLSTAMKIFLTEPYFSVLCTNYGNEYISNQTLLLYASEKNVVLTEPYSSTPLYYGEEYIHNGTMLHYLLYYGEKCIFVIQP